MSENITAYAGDLINTEDMTIAQNLDRIINAKEAIRDAITAKGGQVAEDARIDQYPAAIEELPSGEEYLFDVLRSRKPVDIVIKNENPGLASYAFAYCQNLNTVTIKGSTSSRCFDYATINTVIVDENVTSFGNNVFSVNTNINKMIFNGINTNTPGGGTGQAWGFNLGQIEFGDKVTKLGDYFFYNSWDKNNLRPNGTVGLKGSGADIELPDSLKTITAMAFYSMRSTSYNNQTWLKKIEIPQNVTSMGELCIAYNNNLTEVVLWPVTPPTAGRNVISNNSKLTSIYVPDESVELYQSAANWTAVASLIKPISER